MNFAITAVMFLYVGLGLFAAASLYGQSLYKGKPVSTLGAFIDRAAQEGDTRKVSVWISAHPAEQIDEILRVLVPKSGVLGPQSFFAIFRDELKRGRTKEALFWLQLGRYRMLYDLVRCGASPKDAQAVNDLMNSMPSKRISAYLRAHPSAEKKVLQRVLDFDAKYPAANDPARMCKFIVHGKTPVPKKNWPVYHAALRRMTESYIKRKTQKAPVRETRNKEASKTPAKKDKK